MQRETIRQEAKRLFRPFPFSHLSIRVITPFRRREGNVGRQKGKRSLSGYQLMILLLPLLAARISFGGMTGPLFGRKGGGGNPPFLRTFTARCSVTCGAKKEFGRRSPRSSFFKNGAGFANKSGKGMGCFVFSEYSLATPHCKIGEGLSVRGRKKEGVLNGHVTYVRLIYMCVCIHRRLDVFSGLSAEEPRGERGRRRLDHQTPIGKGEGDRSKKEVWR